MDPLLRSDALLNRETPPQEKLRQALELMQTGLLWKRAALERGSPGANVEEIDEMLRAWLLADD